MNAMNDSADRAITQASAAFVLLTLFLSFALEFLPWPEASLRIKPVFPLLALVYWAKHKPRLINYGAAMVVGFIMDLANQTTFGFNVAACSVVVFMTNTLGGRFVLLGGFAQAVHIFAILAAGQLTLFVLEWLFGELPLVLEWRFFYPSMSAAVLWGALPFLMNALRRQFSRGYGN